MSERAYSEELNEEMSAFKAHKYSLKGKLKSAKAFHCHDPYCGIKLTCSNWAVKDAKRIYFTPSNRDDLHSIACSTVSGDEEKRQVEVETEQGKRTISKNGIIAMRKATNKSKTNHSNEHGVEDVDVVTGERRNNVTKDKKGTEIRVDGELISLNTLFVDAKEEIPVGVNRILFGNAIVTTPVFNDKLVAFEFVDADKPIVYTNKEMLLNRINSKVLNQYLDKGVECQLFFRGSIVQDGKFVSFNGKNYCDLYIME